MKKALSFLCLLGVLFLAVSVYNKNTYNETTIFAMDTVMNIKIKGDDKILQEAEKIIRDIDKKFNAYDPESYIYKLNSGEIDEVENDVAELIKTAIQISYDTNGYFNVALKDLKDLWNLSGDNFKVPEKTKIEEALKTSDYSKIKVEGNKVFLNGMKIDLGGIVKGYATDCVVKMFKENGVKEAIVDLGGNVYAYSDKDEIKIGVQAPFHTRGDVACIVKIKDQAVITSGTYERYVEKDGIIYHHIFDSYTGYPVSNGISSVTVTGESATKCDAYSTALLAMGKEKAEKLYKDSKEFEYLVISDKKVVCSPNFNGEIYNDEYILEEPY